jgi:hypothetical protein
MRRTLLVPTRLRHPSRLAASVLAGAALLSVPACGSDGGTDVSTAETSTSATSATSSSATTATSQAPCYVPGAATDPKTLPAAASGDAAQLTDVRTGRQSCADRIVFDFAGVAPGATVQYSPGPFTFGESGQPITIDGAAFLQLTLAPASGVDLTKPDAPATYTGSAQIVPHGLAHVREIRRLSDFEGQMVWVIGLDSVRQFTEAQLAGPARVYVDIG